MKTHASGTAFVCFWLLDVKYLEDHPVYHGWRSDVVVNWFVLFITMSIRGAGYFNGGFIFCLLEFFFFKKFIKNEIKN